MSAVPQAAPAQRHSTHHGRRRRDRGVRTGHGRGHRRGSARRDGARHIACGSAAPRRDRRGLSNYQRRDGADNERIVPNMDLAAEEAFDDALDTHVQQTEDERKEQVDAATHAFMLETSPSAWSRWWRRRQRYLCRRTTRRSRRAWIAFPNAWPATSTAPATSGNCTPGSTRPATRPLSQVHRIQTARHRARRHWRAAAW